ncbi:MAG: branched-chain amino acid ABC transporter permease [Marinobacter sp.]|nr:branched-chain amino acid ABC transporter permease [Marinobacter sp.]
MSAIEQMEKYSVARSTTASKGAAVVSAFILIVLISVPFWAARSDLRTVVEFAYYLSLAQMWNLLAGYAGLVSVGQQAFVGLGGYMLFVLAIYLNVPPIAAVFLSGGIVALIAIPTALTVFRLRGAYFAIGTWVVAEVFRLGFAQISVLGGGSGQSLPATIVREIGSGRSEREMIIYFTALFIAVLSVGIVYWLLRSKHGLALTAIRDSEPASGSLGVNMFKTKLSVYVLAAGVTGVVGGLIFLQKLRISPEAAFSVQDWTAAVIFIVVIGGIGTIEGPILGTLIYFVLRGLLADYGSVYMIVLGIVAVVVMLKAPQGVWGLLANKYNLYLFPLRRRLDRKNDLER